MLNKEIETKIETLTSKYVGIEGACETKAGEILRAYNRIAYRYYNDGDVVGEGYGRETCNPAARFLREKVSDTEQLIVTESRWSKNLIIEIEYEDFLNALGQMILNHLDKHPELFTEKNEEDMWDYSEDCDVDEENEEDEEY